MAPGISSGSAPYMEGEKCWRLYRNLTGMIRRHVKQAAGFQQLQALEHLTVTAEHLSDRNSAKEKNKITTVSTQDITCEAGQIQCILKPYSWNVLRVKERIE